MGFNILYICNTQCLMHVTRKFWMCSMFNFKCFKYIECVFIHISSADWGFATRISFLLFFFSLLYPSLCTSLPVSCSVFHWTFFTRISHLHMWISLPALCFEPRNTTKGETENSNLISDRSFFLLPLERYAFSYLFLFFFSSAFK